jgi:hypothetical protein
VIYTIRTQLTASSPSALVREWVCYGSCAESFENAGE